MGLAMNSALAAALAALALAGAAQAQDACRPLKDGPDGTVVTDLPATLLWGLPRAQSLTTRDDCRQYLGYEFVRGSQADQAWAPVRKRVPIYDEWSAPPGGARGALVDAVVSGRIHCAAPGRCWLQIDRVTDVVVHAPAK